MESESAQTVASTTEATPGAIEGELDLTPLNLYLSSACCTLLDVNKDKFYKVLHEAANQEVLAQFAQDKNHRSLLVARIDQRGGADNEEEDSKVDATTGASEVD